MDLRATVCACGFDRASGNVENAMTQGRRDVRKARLLLLAGVAAAGVLALLWTVTIPEEALETVRWRSRMTILLLLLGTAIYGVGRGVSLHVSTRRRLGILDRMRQPAPARVVQRNRDTAEKSRPGLPRHRDNERTHGTLRD
jgi:hypothetical protein